MFFDLLQRDLGYMGGLPCYWISVSKICAQCRNDLNVCVLSSTHIFVGISKARFSLYFLDIWIFFNLFFWQQSLLAHGSSALENKGNLHTHPHCRMFIQLLIAQGNDARGAQCFCRHLSSKARLPVSVLLSCVWFPARHLPTLNPLVFQKSRVTAMVVGKSTSFPIAVQWSVVVLLSRPSSQIYAHVGLVHQWRRRQWWKLLLNEVKRVCDTLLH